MTTVELGGLLRGMVETYPNLQPAVVDIDIEFNELLVLGDESLLTQCFGDLLDNAAKFVAPGVRPHIRVWAESVQRPKSKVQSQGAEASAVGHAARGTEHESTLNPVVRVWLEDNGIGIEKPYHGKIWEMFQQLDTSSEGTGIGLALVRKVVERMQGEVGVESEVGHGSRFWVELKPWRGSEGQGPST